MHHARALPYLAVSARTTGSLRLRLDALLYRRSFAEVMHNRLDLWHETAAPCAGYLRRAAHASPGYLELCLHTLTTGVAVLSLFTWLADLQYANCLVSHADTSTQPLCGKVTWVWLMRIEG